MIMKEDLELNDEVILRNKTKYVISEREGLKVLSRNEGKNWVDLSDYDKDLKDTRSKHPAFTIDLVKRNSDIIFKREIEELIMSKQEAEKILSEGLLQKVIIK